jgi:hypothetical protein
MRQPASSASAHSGEGWRPHGDSNPGSYRERVVSWTRLDDGDQPRSRARYGGSPGAQGQISSDLQPRRSQAKNCQRPAPRKLGADRTVLAGQRGPFRGGILPNVLKPLRLRFIRQGVHHVHPMSDPFAGSMQPNRKTSFAPDRKKLSRRTNDLRELFPRRGNR